VSEPASTWTVAGGEAYNAAMDALGPIDYSDPDAPGAFYSRVCALVAELAWRDPDAVTAAVRVVAASRPNG
jgi:hypothetical protein